MTMPTNTTPPAGEPAPTGEPDPTTNPDGQAPDRDAQVAALNAENARWRRQLREKESELEKLRLASASDTERAIAAARTEGAQQYAVRWRKAVVENATLGILAEKGVTAIEPALRSLDLADVDIDDEGNFDRAALAFKVDELIRRWPIFAPSAPPPALPNLSGDTQHRPAPAQPRPGAKMSDAETDAMLRFGMGR